MYITYNYFFFVFCVYSVIRSRLPVKVWDDLKCPKLNIALIKYEINQDQVFL